MADMMDKTINSIITAFIAVVLVASAFIPTVVPMITRVTQLDSGYGTLLGVVVTITIVGIIIGVLKMYTGKSDDADVQYVLDESHR